MLGDIRIVVCHRQWIYVGVVSREADEVVIRRAMNIRRWGTSKGLGELCSGPLPDTILDKYGTIRLHPLQVIHTIDVDAAVWENWLAPV